MDRLKNAIKLREAGNLEEANRELLALVQAYPEDAQVNYQCAWSFDKLGLEKEAVPYYEKAIKIGLPEQDLKEAYLGLGSTYRTIGEYEQSKSLLLEGIARFDSPVLKAFLSMTLYNLGEHPEAMRILLELLGETSSDESLREYREALLFYADKLDRLW